MKCHEELLGGRTNIDAPLILQAVFQEHLRHSQTVQRSISIRIRRN